MDFQPIILLTLVPLFFILQIFFGPFHPILSDNVRFPHVYQIAHKDPCLPHAMVSLMVYFTWNWIGLLILDNDQGTQFLLDLREEMHRNGVCLAFVNVIPDSMQTYMTRAEIYDTRIMTSSAKVVIIYGEKNSNLEASFRRWIASLLKKRVFTNPVGELVNMNLRENLSAEYEIFNIWNFPQSFGLKTKIGGYFPYFPKSQQLHISEDLKWAMGETPVPTSTCSMICTPGFRRFHQEQTPDCCFNCVQCPENEVSNDTDLEQCVSCLPDEYANTEHTHCLKRHLSYLAYEDPLGMALACMSLCFSVLTSLLFGTFVKYSDTPIVKANNRNLSYILLISITLCFLCALLFIGHPNMGTCILQQITFGVFFTVALSTVLAKTITVVLAFKITTPRRRMRSMLISGAPNFVIPLCTLIQLVLCGIWLAVSPPFIDTDTQSEHGQITIVCNKGSVIAFLLFLENIFSHQAL
ncbi:vomeronasal type-2 receptor 116-like [Apodemus sylvaticus]|uniref:vomeronasal type-2 receptor 116-like n=1 Tax=Apodemus sylvaticus TaxID=10129 RepID=UPI0022435ABA|nr:vomeronasal type-2 receptor 116-like [Apodemus sylvaticus]